MSLAGRKEVAYHDASGRRATAGVSMSIRHPATGASVRPALVSVGELFGGVERHLLGLCTYLAQRAGIEPALVLFYDRELARQARALGLSPVILPARHPYSLACVDDLAAALHRSGANLAHAHGYRALVTGALAKWRGRSAIPLVKTEHGRPEGLRRALPALSPAALRYAADRVATRRAARAVTYVTEAVARFYEQAHRGLSRRVVHNGIDPIERAGCPRPSELEAGGVNLGVVGRLSAVKGIPVALRALASPQVPENVRLYLVGAGPLDAALRREATDLGLGERVRFLGFRPDALHFIAHLDCLLMPSRHEGLPYTLLESMSLGTPVIGSRVGGIADVLQDGETGLLVPSEDPDALRRAILRITGDPGLGRALASAAARLQRSRYTLDDMGSRYLALYEECLSGPAHTTGSLP